MPLSGSGPAVAADRNGSNAGPDAGGRRGAADRAQLGGRSLRRPVEPPHHHGLDEPRANSRPAGSPDGAPPEQVWIAYAMVHPCNGGLGIVWIEHTPNGRREFESREFRTMYLAGHNNGTQFQLKLHGQSGWYYNFA
jgi:hypothetical protein